MQTENTKYSKDCWLVQRKGQRKVFSEEYLFIKKQKMCMQLKS